MDFTPKRRWFQFSLRTLLLVTTASAAGTGWVIHERKLCQQGQQAVATVKADEGSLLYEKSWLDRPKWLRSILGDDSFRSVTDVRFSSSSHDLDLVFAFPRLKRLDLRSNRGLGDIDFARIQSFSALEELCLADMHLKDDQLQFLRGTPRLRRLDLTGTFIIGEGLSHLHGCKNLESLNLSHTSMMNEFLPKLRPLRNLKTLNLRSTLVTDAGLTEIGEHPELVELDLGDNKITGEQFDALANLTQLKVLRLDGTHVSDAAFSKLETLRNLKELTLDARAGDAGVSELQKTLPNLMLVRIRK